MKNTTNILKLRNTIGTVYTCACCGREIENVFQVGTKVYGSACVINLFGGLEKEVRNQMALAKSFSKISDDTKKRSMEIRNVTESDLFNQYITTGQI